STAMAAGGMLVITLTAFFVPSVILLQAASRSRERLRALVALDSRVKEGGKNLLSEDETIKRLDSIVVWPLKYPRPIELLVLTALAAGCFFFYKLTLLLLGVMIARGVLVALRVLSSK